MTKYHERDIIQAWQEKPSSKRREVREMSIYAIIFVATVIISIICLIWWYREFGLKSTILYAIYIGVILALLAYVLTAKNAWR